VAVATVAGAEAAEAAATVVVAEVAEAAATVVVAAEAVTRTAAHARITVNF
jgi:hypothetical protein